jgi:hypothetical protein
LNVILKANMMQDIEGKDITVGDECILTINNRGLTKIRITRFTKAGVHYSVVGGYPIYNVAGYIHLKHAHKNLYKL